MSNQSIIGSSLKFPGQFQEGFHHLEEDFDVPMLLLKSTSLLLQPKEIAEGFCADLLKG